MAPPRSSKTIATTDWALAALLVAVLSLSPESSVFTTVEARDTIFDAILPTACVTPALAMAGFCVLQNNCNEECFDKTAKETTEPPAATSVFSLDSPALQDFYIPVDAVECSQMEDPICPATTCCPACRDELNTLYRCLIVESDYNYLDYLATTCPMDCKLYDGSLDAGGSGVLAVGDESTQGRQEEDPLLFSNSTDEFLFEDEGNSTTVGVTLDPDTAPVPPSTGATTGNEIVEVAATDLEKDVIVIVSTPDSVTMVDGLHNTTTTMVSRVP
mmetsp:Transcript_32826/g.68490  ORF Transcript_32826/g.68490 Transcript_32826/m.68490 type:complete len:273 (-) Transcript_32826:364-1182(-)|eukprot:CAMPEP_0201185244 /NCGR_PEP_ID=MMETSP0851-20130426/128285_1 /ASSEMBLY_ACC=CAM_ASM_000631 /TAXON_ID=183588 /ORGANISM="Pseudo-nitzschia fraudulenta, Strain WWA7" /LENGTH=272 /DNA_ID=CAMNT_0047470353 /DNA_START=128 /DNA_END=946 /DNA_ORIENTATION=-